MEMQDFWNSRYASEEYIYGLHPNEFLKSQLAGLPAGKILLPADGEGRNSVYAASQGWEVTAFDISKEGRKKAQRLAADAGVEIDYSIASFEDFEAPENSFDCVAMIYTHISEEMRHRVYQKMLSFLKPGGTFILEVFGKKQLGKGSGGPKDLSMLLSREELNKDFANLKTCLIQEAEIELEEGAYHKGQASVIRLVGTK